MALTDYLSRNPRFEAESNDVYDEEYVINNIIPLYSFIAKRGCLNNEYTNRTNTTDQSDHEKGTKRAANESKQTVHAINKTSYSLNSQFSSHEINYPVIKNSYPFDTEKMPIKPFIIDELARTDETPETQQLINRYREIVKPGIYRKSAGKWKKYHEPKNLRPEKLQIEEKLWMI